MNCCDEYGECRQGRNCPVRQERIERVRRLAQKSRDRNRVPEMLSRLALAVCILLAIWAGSIYHQAFESIS